MQAPSIKQKIANFAPPKRPFYYKPILTSISSSKQMAFYLCIKTGSADTRIG